MAVDTCVKPNFHDDGDDDDEPAFFRRTKAPAKQSRLNTEVKKVSSQRNGEPSKRNEVVSTNGQNSSSQKIKVESSANISATKPSTGNSNASTSVAEKSKSSSEKSVRVNNVEKKPSSKPPAEPNDDSEDSDDDKPLSIRLSTAPASTPGSSSAHVSKGRSSEENIRGSIKRSSEDSDDEIPLSSKFQLKSDPGSSVKKHDSDDDEKSLASKFQQRSSVKKENNLTSSSKTLKKSLDSDVYTSVQSSGKKPKLSDASPSTKVEQSSIKAEPKMKMKAEEVENDDDDVPIAQRIKKAATSDIKSQSVKKTPLKVVSTSFKKTTKKTKKVMKKSLYSKSSKIQPSSGDGKKWTTLEHNGVIFPPPYKPHGVKMLYNGQPVDLTPEQEEVATMFAVMKDTEYATKPKFIENFMNDWRPILGKNHIIKKFELCDFSPIHEWHEREKEKKKQMSTEEKKALKEEKLKQEEKYMWAVLDGVKEKVGNFRVEPPGLFRGRGEHPKMGKLKKRIRPSDITINIGKGAPIPECPIPGQRWKEVKHDNTVTWLAFWNDPINPKEFKYVFLAASSALKGQSDKEKYEKARLLKDYIHGIRANYTKDFSSKDITKRQIAVATYLIDKLALRAGNEKDDDEADTVGCCTLKVENVTLVQPNKLQFDFLGKDSIRYFNTVEVELPVYKAMGQFKTGKKEGEDLFDRLDTSKLNAHLKELMPGLTAKVFRTYNASITLDEMLNKDTKDGDVAEKIVVYNHANKEVAIICNHQRSVSKSHTAQMSKLTEKMDELKAVLDELTTDLSRAKKGKPLLKGADGKPKKNVAPESLEKKIAQTNAKIEKMERDMRSKEDLKTVALGTSKINYLDPRISVAWCKRHEVPIEKIFNKSLLAKFSWAMDVDPSFRF